MPAHVIMTESGPTPEPGRKIVRREEYARWQELETLRASSESFARRLRERALTEYGRHREAARREGEAQGETERMAQLAAFSRDTGNHLRELEAELTSIVAGTLREILGRVPEPERMAALLNRAVSALESLERLTVSAHPDDLAAVERAAGAIAGAVDPVSVRADAALPSGRIRVESPAGIAEASFQAYVDALAPRASRDE